MLLRLFSAAILATLCHAQPGTISTVIGTGVRGSAGDGGPGRSAQLNDPTGVAVDGSRNVYVADSQNWRIRKLLAASDFMQTVAGCGLPTASCSDQTAGHLAGTTLLEAPWDVALDNQGNFYITVSGQHRIRKVGPTGIVVDFAGSGASSAGFSGDNGPATEAKLNNPIGLTVDANGNVYFADHNNQRVRKINTAGIITTIAGTGTQGYSGDGGQAASAQLAAPHGVAVDALGNVYIADTTNNRIRKVAPSGIISTVAGNGNTTIPGVLIPEFQVGDGRPATSATLTPWDVEVDLEGNLYISDWFNHRIRKVDGATGIITTLAGNGTPGYSGDGGPASAAQVNFPTGLALDSHANLYFADNGNQRVRKIEAPALGLPVIRTTIPVVPVFMGKAGFSSNMFLEIYGSNFSRASRVWGSGDFDGPNAPTSLDGVSVTVNNKPAFIYYVGPGQININVPDDTVTGSVAIQVRTSEGVSNAVAVPRSRLSPTMLTNQAFNVGGTQYVVALTADFVSFIGRPNMIPGLPFVAPRPGETISIYALGLGPTSPSTFAGVAAGQNSTVVLDLQVKIGGVQASVPFKGVIQGTIGLYQLNVTIPSVPPGDHKIDLSVDGVPNNQDLSIVVGP